LKKTIYFLEWLKCNGIDVNYFLNCMRPENQKWSMIEVYPSIEVFLKKMSVENYIEGAFNWSNSNYKNLNNISEKWKLFCYQNKDKIIKFSREPIIDYKVNYNNSMKLQLKFEGD